MNSPTEAPAASIVIADDDEILREMMRAVLEREGFVVVEAADGEDAFEKCGSSLPDLVISDAAMPRLDGFDLCRRIRGTPSMAHLPILIATGLGDSESIARAYDCGATDFIAKPINWDVLPHRVRYILRAARAFETLRSSHEALEAASEAKSNFMALVSHELRTPLNAIIGFSTMMRDGILGPLPTSYESYPEQIAESGEHLLQIINSVLDVANAEEDRLVLNRRAIDIGDVTGYVYRIFESEALRAEVGLSVEIEENLPRIHADLDKLRQVVTNLVSNSIKFTPPGGRMKLTVCLEDDRRLAIRVEDTGIGISPEQIETAMTPFGQVDSRLSRKYDGIGLGLPISKRLVELHGGTLSIESEIRQGTRVIVRLPGECLLPRATVD